MKTAKAQTQRKKCKAPDCKLTNNSLQTCSVPRTCFQDLLLRNFAIPSGVLPMYDMFEFCFIS